uniref:N-acetylmuramoyl-L-alanine amidase n=1 Tax=Streptomyces tabacisoli TaxID=3156398 RepID=UPI003EB9C50B
MEHVRERWDGGRRVGKQGSGGKDRDRGISRRTLIVGGVASAVGVGLLARGDLARMWWQMPGVDKPRTAGAVDFKGAEWVAAAAANWRRADRPADYPIDMVVVHVTQGSYSGTLQVFKDPWHGASAHYVVRKDGHIAQMIRELDVAFHAGNRDYNQRSIGIEHEGFVDRPEDFTAAMYASSAKLTAGICRRYGIPVDRKHIIGHVEVPGTDHTDPGLHWDWDRYMRLVRAAYKQAGSAKA